MTSLLICTLILIVLSAIFSGTEAALFSVSESKAEQMKQNGECTELFYQLVKNRDGYISTIVFNNNIINIMGSIIVGNMALMVFGNGVVNIVYSIALTISIIVFAEIIPKAIGMRKAVAITKFMSRPLSFLKTIFSPFVFLTTKFSDTIIRILLGNIKEPITSEDEIKYLANAGAKDTNSEIKKDEAEIIQNVFLLNDQKAKDIMTPRNCMTYIYGNKTVNDNYDLIMESQHSRIIVIGKTQDDVLGVVLKSQILKEILKDNKDKKVVDLDILMRAKEVKYNVKAATLLKIFQKESTHLAIVKDKFGGVDGIVTLEDVIEIITGEIVDETDQVEDLRDFAESKNKAEKKLKDYREKQVS